MYSILWLFLIYAFLGWCAEVCYAALRTGRFVNRGFLNGPVCPIYGFGVLIVLTCLEPLRENLLLLFLGSVVLTSLLEWVTGLLLEKLFHQRWWDYSDQPLNLGGYICLRFSILWGLACLFVVKIVHPSVLLLVRLIPRPLGWTLLASVPTLIQNFLYYSAAFRMFFDYLASPSGILMTPDASVLLLPSWAWTLITGVWVVAVTMFYLPHYYCAQLTLFEEAKAACPSRRGPDGLGGL